MAFLIKTDGTVTDIEPKNGKNFKLEELYELIGCQLIQTCPAQEKGKILIFDEEGLYMEKPLNQEATMGMHDDMGPFVYNIIVGTAVMCNDGELK